MTDRAKANVDIKTLSDQEVENVMSRTVDRDPVEDDSPSKLDRLRVKRAQKREDDA